MKDTKKSEILTVLSRYDTRKKVRQQCVTTIREKGLTQQCYIRVKRNNGHFISAHKMLTVKQTIFPYDLNCNFKIYSQISLVPLVQSPYYNE